ncbi:PREDICTED: uncharacterized protein LOC107068422 [Polistes dominula]|uniref:Gustatory receptor n=1 Tax=Polistes dominula TaxID=743375 RepID=A0ABM1IJ64_POLDO|nr:PREDICTED: uncharacterized protein LOC107068422 [Polistes dominula]
MTKSLNDAFFPLLITSSILGLTVLEWPMSKIITYVNILYIILLWIVYFISVKYLAIYESFSNYYKNGPSVISLYFIEVTTIASVLSYLYNSKNLVKCLKKMSVLDDTLKELGFQMEYTKIRKLMILVVVGWFISTILLNTCDIILSSIYGILPIIILCVTNHTVHINTILDLSFIIFLLYQRNRFRKLNEYIIQRCQVKDRTRNMFEDHMTNTTYCSNVMKTNLEDYDIWISMHIHLELSRICNNLNTIFEIPMLLEMISFFISGIALIGELYATLTNSDPLDDKIGIVLNLLIWNSFYFMKLYVINYTCEIVKVEANRTQILTQKVMDYLCLKIRAEVFQFISEINYKRVNFSAFGFYEYGYTFIHQFCGAITTYLIILLQVETTPNNFNNTTSIVNFKM